MSAGSPNFSYIIFTIFLTNTNAKFDFYRFIFLCFFLYRSIVPFLQILFITFFHSFYYHSFAAANASDFFSYN